MRGAHGVCLPCFGRAGIIPAYAGSTSYHLQITAKGKDHPRVCGEHERYPSDEYDIEGSSPRMRGARNTLTAASGSSRIIPAYAGSTAATLILVSVLRDHPRVCGEHLWQAVPKAWRAGSSPRMRGALWQAVPKAWRAGIIPAYAGSTDVENRRPVDTWDHPRVCGEHGSD